MYISEIQKRLMDSIGKEGTERYNRAKDLAVSNGARPDEMNDAYHIALWFEGAPSGVKADFLDQFNWEENDDLRICSHCGRFMTEGYLICGYSHACSEDCAIAQYEGDEEAFREDVRESVEEGNGDTFWTEW